MDNSTTIMDILLVEDSPDDAEMTIRTLKKFHVSNDIVHLKNGEEALDYIFCRGKFSGKTFSRPKVILLDLKMPKVSGIEVLEVLKANEKTKTIPVVVLTSSNEHPDIKKCYELGVNSYIVKPVGFEGFTKAIIEIGGYWLVHNKPAD